MPGLYAEMETGQLTRIGFLIRVRLGDISFPSHHHLLPSSYSVRLKCCVEIFEGHFMLIVHLDGFLELR